MKKILLSAALLSAAFGFSQTYSGNTYLLNELITSPTTPSGITATGDVTLEYLEFRSISGADFPANTYLISVEGDGSSNPGEVKEAIDLSSLAFGTNGYLSLIYRGGTAYYDTVLAASEAAVYDETTVTTYDGDLENHSVTYMLITSSSNPDGVDIDTDDDGSIDNAATWTIYDSVSNLDDEDSSLTSYGYGQTVFVQNYSTAGVDPLTTYFVDPIATEVISLDDSGTSESRIHFMSRNGSSTGNTAADWVGGQLNSSTTLPNWALNGTDLKTHPNDLSDTNSTLPDSTFGGENLTAVFDADNVVQLPTLSNNDFTIDGNKVTAYQPTSETIAINGVEVDAANVYALNGAVVAKGAQTVDVSTLSTGVYILQVESNGKSTAKTIVVQ